MVKVCDAQGISFSLKITVLDNFEVTGINESTSQLRLSRARPVAHIRANP